MFAPSARLVALALSLACLALTTCEIEDPRVKELVKLRDASRDGVIVIDGAKFEALALSPSRPYSLAVMLNSRQFQHEEGLQLGRLHTEFAYAGKAFKAGPAPDGAFFVEMFYEDAMEVFARLGANSLPYVFVVPPKATFKSGGPIAVPESDKMTSKALNAKGGASYPWPANYLADFVRSRTGAPHAPVRRPSITDTPGFWAGAGAAASAVLLLAYVVLKTGVWMHPGVWAVGAIAVFWFSTSGGMYNIIRGIPIYIRDQKGKLVFSVKGRSGQLGAEGYLMGSAYLAVSLCLALTTWGVPAVRNRAVRTGMSSACIAIASYIVFKVFQTYNAKTGYQIRTYLW